MTPSTLGLDIQIYDLKFDMNSRRSFCAAYNSLNLDTKT